MKRLLSIVMAVLMSGCALAQSGTGTGKAMSTPDSSGKSGTQNTQKDDATPSPAQAKLPRANPPLFIAFADKCPLSGQGSTESPTILLPIIASLFSNLVTKAVPVVTGYLYDKGLVAVEEHNAKLTASPTASTVTTYYSNDATASQFGCIILSRAERGAFDKDKFGKDPKGNPIALGNGSQWAVGNADVRAARLNISRVPEFYMELSLAPIKGVAADPKANPMPKARTLYRKMTPSYIDFLKSGAEDHGDGTKHVAIELNIEAMDDKGKWQPLFARTYDLGKIKELSENISVGSLGEEVFNPPLPRVTADGLIDPIPLRITAVMTETDDNHDLARAFEASLKDAQVKAAIVDGPTQSIVDQLTKAINTKLAVQPAGGAAAAGPKK